MRGRRSDRLSLAECRRLVADESITDKELERLREGLYAIARATTQTYSKGTDRNRFNLVLSALPEDDRAEIEERAAISEFEGKLSRDQAERLALCQYKMKPPRV